MSQQAHEYTMALIKSARDIVVFVDATSYTGYSFTTHEDGSCLPASAVEVALYKRIEILEGKIAVLCKKESAHG